ncbi:hypothetical protein C8R47DRAFT_1176898 [Mycena vitilis]|nr:hypothetical protein C8R47DRAFT_1176898 [Mycena vitilis]
MFPRSTRNTRIERLWVEVGSQFARRWRGFFLRLERLHNFDPDNPNHLWLLHLLFLDDLNKDCDEFQDHWNHHPISGKGNDQTPADMRFMGELKYGKYADTFDLVHPEVLERYGNENDIDVAIAGDQDHHIRHEAIQVAETECPFSSAEATAIFLGALTEVQSADIIPCNFGVAEVEWESQFYPQSETVKVGRKEVEITLPFDIWWPRAVTWAQGLEIMVRIQAAENNEIVA